MIFAGSFPFGFVLLAAGMILTLVTGCSTAFKYTPQNRPDVVASTPRPGLAIQTGQDARPFEERQPDWARNAEPIVAHVLAYELKTAKLFRRVKIHARLENPWKYPEIVRFQVIKFECYDDEEFLEKAGRNLLRLDGIRGELIAASIPVKYNMEVTLEFEVVNAATQQSVFIKDYSATRTVSVNGYQGESPKIQQMSAALEEVITQFVWELRNLPLGH